MTRDVVRPRTAPVRLGRRLGGVLLAGRAIATTRVVAIVVVAADVRLAALVISPLSVEYTTLFRLSPAQVFIVHHVLAPVYLSCRALPLESVRTLSLYMGSRAQPQLQHRCGAHLSALLVRGRRRRRPGQRARRPHEEVLQRRYKLASGPGRDTGALQPPVRLDVLLPAPLRCASTPDRLSPPSESARHRRARRCDSFGRTRRRTF